ncbi:MAG: hypothetical protein CMG07_05780 [Candidatus Marinimicrobia bacterium]|nr:hypothetical protein [Candidatus Neomarinimicrobiota bacterium]
MNFSIPKSSFFSTLSKSNSYFAKDLQFFYFPQSNKKIGFIVSKKYGSSSSRFLFKRRCRFIYLNNSMFPKKISIGLIIKPKKNIQISYDSIYLNFLSFLNYIKNNGTKT